MKCCVCGTEIAPGQPAMRHDPTGAIYCYPHEGLYLDHRLMEPSDYGRCGCGFVYSAEHRIISSCPQCGVGLGGASLGGGVVSGWPVIVPEPVAPPAEPSPPMAPPPPELDSSPPPPASAPSASVTSSPKPGLQRWRGRLTVAAVVVAAFAVFVMTRSDDTTDLPQQPLQVYANPGSFHDDLTAAGIDCPGFGGVEGWSTENPGAYGEKAWGDCQIDESTTISVRIYRSPADLAKGIAAIQAGPVGKVAHLVSGERWVVMVNESGTGYTDQILRITGGHEVTG